ncbi:hypothetical protein X975_10475, partial [Stegodyphus mimosarum]
MKSELKENGKFSTPGKKRPLKVGTQTRIKRYDELTLAIRRSIRRKVHSFFLRNEIPTVKKVAKVINDEADLPNMSIRTVGRMMNDLGFAYRKRKRQSILIERDDIQCWRHRYLRDIKKYHAQGRTIYYTDET